jgi:hypothetical protein
MNNNIVKAKNLLASIKKITLINFLLLVSFFIINASISYFAQDQSQKSKDNNKGVIIAQNKLNELNNKIKEISNAKKLWNDIQNQNIDKSGLKIEAARSFIASLEKKYYLSNPIAVNISAPDKIVSDSAGYSIAIMQTEMSLSITSVSDEMVLGAVNELLNQFPGYLIVKNFDIRKIADLDEKLLQEIYNGDKPELVVAEISLIWRDLIEANDSLNIGSIDAKSN